MEATFSDHSHTGSIRAVAINEDGFLASGSSDETIRLFNLKKNTEVGCLMQHEGVPIFLEVAPFCLY